MHMQSPCSADQTIYQVLPTVGRGIRNVYGWEEAAITSFMFKQKLLERKEQNFGVTQEFLNVDLKQILVRTTHVGWGCPVSKKQPEFMAKCQWWDKYGWLHLQPLASCCWLNLFNQKHALHPLCCKTWDKRSGSFISHRQTCTAN